MSRLFPLAEDTDRSLELAKFLAATTGSDADALAETLKSAVEGGKIAEFLASVLKHQETVVSKATEDEAEGFYIILTSFFKGLPSESAITETAQGIAKFAASSTEQRPALRLKIMVHMYNNVEGRDAKLALLTAIISYAASTKQLELLAPYLAGAAAWQREWELSDAEARALFLLLSQVYNKAGIAQEAQAFLIRYLATFEHAAPAALEEAKEHARDAALGYIRAPALSQRSALAHLAAVRALAGDARYGKLHELLTIFASQGLEEYAAFHAANAPFVASLGVDHEASTRTMRLLTLCSLAASKSTLSYDAIAAAIQVPAAEVEAWVVQAIAEGLIDARMDQTTATVTVTRAMQREFGQPQWVQLQGKLRAWRDNVASLLSLVDGSARP